MIKELIGKIKNGESRTAKAGKQVFFSFLFQAISIVVSLLYVPLLLNYLSQEKYGIWLTLTSIISWFGFFDIGLGNGMRNKLAEAMALDRKDLANKYVSTTYALLTIIFLSILLLFLAANPFIDWNAVLNSKSITAKELTLLAGVVFTLFILRFIVQLVGVIYLADLKPAVNNAINALAGVLSLSGVYMLTQVSNGGNLVSLGMLVTAMPVILFCLLSVIAFSGKYSYLKPSWKNIDFSRNKDLLTLGVKFFLLQITAVIMYSTSSFFISQFYGPGEVVIYNLSFRYFQIPVMIYTIVLSPLWSSVTNAWVSDDFGWLRTTMKRLNYLSLLFLAGIIFMVFMAETVFRIWVGDKIKVPLSLNVLMAVFAGINIFIAPYWNFINGTGKLKLTMLFNLLGTGLYFLFIFLAAKQFNDSSGVMIAVIIPLIIFAFSQPFQSHRLLSKRAKGILAE